LSRKKPITEVLCPTCIKETINKICRTCGAQFGTIKIRESFRVKLKNDIPKIKDAIPNRIEKDRRAE